MAEGAETGSVARRREPGASASSPPNPMSNPPVHNQATSGSTTTPMTTDPAGRLATIWLPDVLPSPPTWSNVRYTSPNTPESIAGVPTVARAPPKLVVAGAKVPPSTLTSASSDVFDGMTTFLRPMNSNVWPS